MPFNSVFFELIANGFLCWYALFCLRYLQIALADVWVTNLT